MCFVVAFSLFLLIGVVLPVHAAPMLNLAAEAGPELDTNATRLQQTVSADEAPIRSGLIRFIAGGNMTLRPALNHLFVLDYGGGAKLFLSGAAQSADEVVQHGDLFWMAKLSPGTFSLSANYYDAIQRGSLRDFRTGGGSLQFALEKSAPAMTAAFHVAYRGLQYKPDSNYSFNGLQGGLSLGWNLTSNRGDAVADWNLSLSYTISPRFYNGEVVLPQEQCGPGDLNSFCTENSKRQDVNHLLRAEMSYLGDLSGSLWYAGEINRSNSYGETFTRHVVGIKFTSHLAWDVFLTAKCAIQLSRFRDPFFTSVVSNLSLISIDEENRSSLMAQLARDLSDHWPINLRYSLYVNESSSAAEMGSLTKETAEFLRHTLFLGVRFEYSH